MECTIDSTWNPYYDSIGQRDGICSGLSFSPNGKFLYISKRANIYQLEYNLSLADSATAWYRVRKGFDTSDIAFEYYNALSRGIDDRIYIGKVGGSFTQFSTIDSPNNKGAACGFCAKCFRVDSAYGGLTNPPNMPDYNLGFTSCNPMAINDINLPNVTVYPNPTINKLVLQNTTDIAMQASLYNSIGQQVLTQVLNGSINTIDVSPLPQGIYTLKLVLADGSTGVRKIVIGN